MLGTVIGLVASASTNQVVTNIVRATTPKNIDTGAKVLTKIGGIVIGMAVGTVVSDSVGKSVDAITEILKPKQKKDGVAN